MNNHFSRNEEKIIKNLNNPKKIQSFINNLKINFDYHKDTCQSPSMVLESRKAHCIEGAILAVAILNYHGYPAFILDLESTKEDYDHVVALFKKGNFFGAISKTNHYSLRYREPIYKTVRELVLSYFHEYFLNKNGKKTLRRYSGPIDLKIFNKYNWISSSEDIWFIPEYLTNIKHYPILDRNQIQNLRKADPIEIKAGKLNDFKYKK